MASAIKAEDDNRPSTAADTSAAEAALKAKLSRKRTKTGCLTCRKRRIKCGEERPVCRNCIKSKRPCEGYNQRVVFKPPTFDYQPVPNGGAHITFQAGPVQIPANQHHELQSTQFDPSVYGQLRPRPVEQPQHVTVWDSQLQRYVTIEQPNQHNGLHPVSPEYGRHTYPAGQAEPGAAQVHGYQVPTSAQFVPPNHPQYNNFAPQLAPNGPGIAAYPGHNQHQFSPDYGHVHFEKPNVDHQAPAPATTLPAEYISQTYQQTPPVGQMFPGERFQHSPNGSTNQHWQDPKPSATNDHNYIDTRPLSATSSRTMSFPQTTALPQQQQWTPVSQTPAHAMPAGSGRPLSNAYFPETAHRSSATSFSQAPDGTPLEFYEHAGHAPTYCSTTDVLSAAAIEMQDDDYYDVASDEEVDVTTTSPQQSQKQQRTLSRILAHNKISVGDLQMRRYDTFIYAGILDHYRVDEVASPLKNPATARVFAHFVSATGPSLSIFERHPRNTSVLFAEGGIPFSQQGLWTYTMPMAALRNQGLLHAMLAIASLHIARLQNASVTPSMQHYAWALRRIHASVGKPESRLKVSTMAASMLLGFYEIMTADHMKWNTHLAGSKQLFVETDFVKMAKEFRRLKLERAATIGYSQGRKRRHSSEDPFSQSDMLDQILDVDDRVVSEMIGREVRYGDHGHVEAAHVRIPPGHDLGKFEILKDLYWWYCKQDVYQSLVSGNPLLMDFGRWGDCPPRAPLGRVDAVYGTFDHLVLLLGRIADFASRDRDRKLKQVEANGGQWKPNPKMNIPRPPPQAAPPPTPVSANGFPMAQGFGQPQEASLGGINAMPQFYGMAPPPRANVQMPATYAPFAPAYSAPTPQSAYPPVTSDYNLQDRLESAMEEYGRIRSALHTFSTSLGHAFEPLTSEYHTEMNTPFGTALFYRSYDIGCLWAIYNMAMIIAIRSHPYMPPAAHVAAGVAAQETSHYAREIGRIAAGIVPGPPEQPLNPTLGAALCESCMPSFFAAVQYRDIDQRHSTVERIYSIAKRTGWGSAELIANGCETAWVKAAAAGRGPPYTRIVRPDGPNEDPRLNGSWENLDPNAKPDENDDSDRRLVKIKPNARLNWAIGVMGVEEDVQKINING